MLARDTQGPGHHLLPGSGAPGPGFRSWPAPLRSGASHLCHPEVGTPTDPTSQELLVSYGLNHTVKPPTRAPGPSGPPIVSEQPALYSGRLRRGWQSVRRGDGRPLHRLGTICGWSRPVLFLRGQGWSDLAFGVQASTSRLEVRPRCEDGSQVSPLRPLEGTRLAEGGLASSHLATQLCSLLWPGGAEVKPRVPHGKGHELPSLASPKLYLRPQTEQPPRQGAGSVKPEGS